MNGISLTIPFYNEESILEDTLRRTWDFLTARGEPFELILADDGSTDRSRQIAVEFQAAHTEACSLLRNAENRGRGSVLAQAFAQSRMPVVAYVDADLEIELPFVGELFTQFNRPEVYVCTGSKLVTPQHHLRAQHRKIASVVYNRLVRYLLNSNVSDHQCGLKGFRKELLERILPHAREEGWAWDTEMLLLAQRNGYRVHEFPVELHSKRKSTVPLIPTIVMFSIKILQFRQRGLLL